MLFNIIIRLLWFLLVYSLNDTFEVLKENTKNVIWGDNVSIRENANKIMERTRSQPMPFWGLLL
jgi:hypothetical protein